MARSRSETLNSPVRGPLDIPDNMSTEIHAAAVCVGAGGFEGYGENKNERRGAPAHGHLGWGRERRPAPERRIAVGLRDVRASDERREPARPGRGLARSQHLDGLTTAIDRGAEPVTCAFVACRPLAPGEPAPPCGLVGGCIWRRFTRPAPLAPGAELHKRAPALNGRKPSRAAVAAARAGLATMFRGDK